MPLGLIDIALWARDVRELGKAKQRKQRPIGDKESQRWFDSHRRTAEFQRKVDEKEEPKPLLDYLPTQALLGTCKLAIPARGGRKARVAALEIRGAPIQLRSPKRLNGAPALSLWAVQASEPTPPAGSEAIE